MRASQVACVAGRRRIPELVDALRGHFEAYHALLVSHVLPRIDLSGLWCFWATEDHVGRSVR